MTILPHIAVNDPNHAGKHNDERDVINNHETRITNNQAAINTNTNDINNLKVADQAAASGSIRTLGTGPLQAAPGNHFHVPDQAVVRATVGGTYSPTTAKTADPGYTGCDIVFTAPVTGRVLLKMTAYLEANTGGQTCVLTPEVRQGSTMRAGTVIYAANQNADGIGNYNTGYVRATSVIILTGLTPGAQYNAYAVLSCGAAGANYTVGSATAIPL